MPEIKKQLLEAYGSPANLARQVMGQHVLPLLQERDANRRASLEAGLQALCNDLWATGAGRSLVNALRQFGPRISPELVGAYLSEIGSAAFGDYEAAQVSKARAKTMEYALCSQQQAASQTATRVAFPERVSLIAKLVAEVPSYI